MDGEAQDHFQRCAYFTDPTLPEHTIYMPPAQTLPRQVSLQVLIWAEGGCDNNRTRFEPRTSPRTASSFSPQDLRRVRDTYSKTPGDDAVTWIQERTGKEGSIREWRAAGLRLRGSVGVYAVA
ncbi:hypothetical protein BJY01DRAFT_247800 [Aspergillus pseudoustus]|uniref:Uncharacterized protein n=1 Tax=Aspergillus pseudoustus TaxID=1810923 RepID=A0ABR4JYT2_9EURO